MRVTVVTPSFNQASFIAATLESVRSQLDVDVEHIVIDGGSTDGTVDVIREHAKDLAYWVSEPDGGQTEALIKGFARATGEILCWLNSDDVLEPHALASVVHHFLTYPSDRFIYGDAIWIDRGGRVIKHKREHRFSRFVWLYDHNFIPQPSAFWRADLYREVGGLDHSFSLAMDADLWWRFSAVTRPVHVRQSWSRMRFYPEQKNTRLRGASLTEMQRIRDRYGYRSSAPKRLAARVGRVLLKASTGAYEVSDLGRGVRRVLGGPTWEEVESQRS